MAQPPSYSLSYSFTDHSANYPTTPQPGVRLDTEFRNLQTTLAAVLVNLAKIQRDDGALKNGVVGPDALSSEFSAGLRSVTDWTSLTDFVANDAAWKDGALYLCAVGHTSGSFATDLAAGKWTLLFDINPYAETAAETAVTAEVLAGISLDVDLGPINTALAGKAALAGGNAFTGSQSFADPVSFASTTSYAAKTTITISPASTAADYAEWRPSDYGSGKPSIKLRKAATANTWEFVVADGAAGATVLDLQATNLTHNGVALLKAGDIDNTALETSIRRAKHLARAF